MDDTKTVLVARLARLRPTGPLKPAKAADT
jgi:hypothetical protein